MAVHVLDAMARGGFEEVVAVCDRRSGLRGFLAVHDSSPGRAFGGIRRRSYRDENEALLDCLRLAKAMSFKCALAEVPGGGAKMVLFDRQDTDPAEAYRAVGRWIEGRGGHYYAGPDVGTGERELAWVAEETSYATQPGPQGPGNLAEATAAGVFAGMAAALRELDGRERWARRTVVVQGMGNVGTVLAERLLGLGARVLACELDPAHRRRAERRLAVEWVDPGAETGIECDVFAPCALGGVLHDLSIPRLKARIVCGAANNVLARTFHGDVLHERGVLYVPDFVVNAGAVLRGAEFHLSGRPTPLSEIEERLGASAADVLRRAAEEGVSPVRVAVREAERRIEGRRRRAARVRGGPRRDVRKVGSTTRDRRTGVGDPVRP